MRSPVRRALTAALISALAAAPLAAVSATATATPAQALFTELRINEVESNGGTPGDWIELTNIGATEQDAGGLVLKDNDDTHIFTIPVGTIIPAGGFATFDVDGAGGFGLGGADSARLLAADGTTYIDSYSWSAHAAGTYGRCADGTGAFTALVTSTKGAANACETTPIDPATVVRINEVESNGGTPGDWVELTNIGTAPISVDGLVIKDDDDTHAVTIAAGTTIPAGGFVTVDTEGTEGFGLGGADSARLFKADGTTLIDSYSWTTHASASYGRCPDGTGAFAITDEATKAVANDCFTVVPPATPSVTINEIESNGGTPGDWVELYNSGATTVDLAGWKFQDNDDTHLMTLPAGASIAAGGYYVIEEGTFGLGTADSARLFLADGTTLVDSHSWTAHSPTTLSRCPNATGTWGVSTSSTKGAANDCGLPIRINEVESSGGTPGDWIELTNAGSTAQDIGGLILKDNDDTHVFTIPAGVTLPAGGFAGFVVDTTPGFGLGSADSARLFTADGTTLLDSYSWTAHATTTYGRCPDGTGAFATTVTSTIGAANSCVGAPAPAEVWPGGTTTTPIDQAGFFGQDMSGLDYEPSGTAAPGTLWAVNNGTGTLFKLTQSGATWVPASGTWSAGKTLAYPTGPGGVDAEGVTLVNDSAANGVYVSSERNSAANSTSRPSVLRYDVSGSATTLVATHEWNLASDLPAIGANSGLEGITWVPDSFLTEQGLIDEGTGAAYNPADHPGHGTGLFFVALEATGSVYVYALDHVTGGFDRIATIVTGFPGAMEVDFEAETGSLWALCDEACAGKTVTLKVAQSGEFDGKFVVTHTYARPADTANIANEGFTISPQALCVDGLKPTYYADDAGTDSHALRTGTIACTPSPAPPAPVAPTKAEFTHATKNDVTGPATAAAGSTISIKVGKANVGKSVDVWVFSQPVHLGTFVVPANGVVKVALPASLSTGVHRVAVVREGGGMLGWFQTLVHRPVSWHGFPWGNFGWLWR